MLLSNKKLLFKEDIVVINFQALSSRDSPVFVRQCIVFNYENIKILGVHLEIGKDFIIYLIKILIELT